MLATVSQRPETRLELLHSLLLFLSLHGPSGCSTLHDFISEDNSHNS